MPKRRKQGATARRSLQGTQVDYRAGSLISRKARASSAFLAVNKEVQETVLSQLKAGRTRLRLSAATLPPVAFESKTSDLYWGFRGTQGLTVTGVCGAPQHPGGARWFPDTITVTVPFNRPA